MADIANSLKGPGLRHLERYLADLGIRVRRVKERARGSRSSADAELDIRLPNGDRRRIVVEFKSNPRRAPIESALAQLRNYVAHLDADAQPLIFSTYFGRPMREWLRSQGVWFADLAGNRFFSAPGLMVDREVATDPKQQRNPRPAYSRTATHAFFAICFRVLRYASEFANSPENCS